MLMTATHHITVYHSDQRASLHTNICVQLPHVGVLPLQAWYRKRWPPGQISASVALVVGGFIIAGIGDLTFDLVSVTGA